MLLVVAFLCVVAVSSFSLSTISRTQRSSALMMGTTPLTNGAKRVEVPSGSSLLAATKKLGMKVPLSCKKGDCGVCTVNVAGKNMRACIGKVPDEPRLKSLKEKGLPVKLAG